MELQKVERRCECHGSKDHGRNTVGNLGMRFAGGYGANFTSRNPGSEWDQ